MVELRVSPCVAHLSVRTRILKWTFSGTSPLGWVQRLVLVPSWFPLCFYYVSTVSMFLWRHMISFMKFREVSTYSCQQERIDRHFCCQQRIITHCPDRSSVHASFWRAWILHAQLCAVCSSSSNQHNRSSHPWTLRAWWKLCVNCIFWYVICLTYTHTYMHVCVCFQVQDANSTEMPKVKRPSRLRSPMVLDNRCFSVFSVTHFIYTQLFDHLHWLCNGRFQALWPKGSALASD
jgi:hypothetical protein